MATTYIRRMDGDGAALPITEISLSAMPQDYTAHLAAVRCLGEHPLSITSPVAVLVGENGTGKSTLLEAIAVSLGFNAEGGTRNFRFATRSSHGELHRCIRTRGTARVRDGFFLRVESFYNVATNLEELDRIPAASRKLIESYGGVSLHEQSHGESFLALMENRFTAGGLYLLDEPEAALSPMRCLRILCRMRELADGGAQFILATHSPILMAYPGADVFSITESGIQRCDYRETEHFRVMRRFVGDPEGMLRGMLE